MSSLHFVTKKLFYINIRSDKILCNCTGIPHLYQANMKPHTRFQFDPSPYLHTVPKQLTARELFKETCVGRGYFKW